MAKIPNKETIKNLSAILSSNCFFLMFGVLIQNKEKTDEIVSSSAIMEANSSMRRLLDLLAICSELMMNRQKPNSLCRSA